MKIAVFFPGVGYHCDKSLLYYSAAIAGQYQYELYKLVYTKLSKSKDGVGKITEETFKQAFAQTEEALAQIDWNQYEDVLFVSKSIGTIVASAYAKKHGIKCRNVYYTPLEKTFAFDPQPGIVFHGTNDKWVETEIVKEQCQKHGLPLHIIEGVNHSLEFKDDTMRNLRILTRVLELTESYIADGIWDRQLVEENL